jgi:hypothetical protein
LSQPLELSRYAVCLRNLLLQRCGRSACCCLRPGGCERCHVPGGRPSALRGFSKQLSSLGHKKRSGPKRTSLGFGLYTTVPAADMSLCSRRLVASSSLPRCRTPPCRRQTRTSCKKSATAQHVLRGDRFTTNSWRRAFDGSYL